MNALKKISKSPVSLLNFQPWCGQSLRLTWLVHYLHHLAHDLPTGRSFSEALVFGRASIFVETLISVMTLVRLAFLVQETSLKEEASLVTRITHRWSPAEV